MSAALSVNHAIDQLPTLDGEHVCVEAVLEFDFECVCLWHFPKAERRDKSPSGIGAYASSIWLTSGSGAAQLNRNVLAKWSGHRVRVMGVLRKPGTLGGCGHMSGWPAEIEAISIDRL
jgi:hypothetical protein